MDYSKGVGWPSKEYQNVTLGEALDTTPFLKDLFRFDWFLITLR